VGQRPASPEEIQRRLAIVVIASVLCILTFTLVSRARSRAANAAEPASQAHVGPPIPVPMEPIPTSTVKKAPPIFYGSLSPGGTRTQLLPEDEAKIVKRAREEMERVWYYDNSWMETSGYPMGDIPPDRGACTDVVVRSLRAVEIDLQQLVHEDIVNNGSAYALAQADTHIDHRRVGTMLQFFQRNAMSLPTDTKSPRSIRTFRPGDVVFFAWSYGRLAPPEHVGVVSDQKGPRGLPLVIQNGGPRPTESDNLDHGKLVGHFRALPRPGAAVATASTVAN
jgi:hypothetical protein